MTRRTLSTLTVTHRGVPIGTTPLVEEDREQSIEPLLPPELRRRLDRNPSVYADEFTPLPAFDTLAPTIELAQQAVANFGFLGPAADPASERAGDEAIAAVRHLCAELELWDETGALVPAPVFDICREMIGVALDEVPAGVLARLRRRASGGGESEPTAT